MRLHWNRFIPLFIFSFALLTRLLWPQVPINTDETLWIERGALFFAAFLDGKFSESYLRHHPGVINMWLIGGAFSVGYLLRNILPLSPPLAEFAHQSTDLSSYLKIIASNGLFPVEAYVQVRILFAFVTAACVTGIYGLTRRLLGEKYALLMAILLLLEPFFLAYQRFITTDGHLTNFLWLAFLAFLLYLHEQGKRRWLLLSSLCYGLALLSKVTALLSLPAIWGWWLMATFDASGWRKFGLPRAKLLNPRGLIPLLLWSLGVLISCFVLWPVLWVDLWGTVMRLVADLRQEVGGHYQFFLGDTTDDPGWIYYPIVLCLRLSPALLIGSFGGLVGLFVNRKDISGHIHRVLVPILINLLVLLLAMSSQSSKLDRYIIPLIPGLAILAAAGWLWIIKRGRMVVVSALILLLQLPIFLLHFPLNVTYFNPLLGGPTVAQKILMIGNGELLEQAAQWIEEQSNHNKPTVASWYRQVFGAYYDGPTTSMWSDSVGKWRWVEGRYAVLYVNQIQRHLPFVEIIDYFTMQQPLVTVTSHGVNYAYIYNGPLLLPEELPQISFPTSFNFEEKAKLLGYDIAQQVPSGERSLLTLYWEALEPFPDQDYFVFLRLRLKGEGPMKGRIYKEMSAKPVAGFLPVDKWEKGQLIRDVKEIKIPPGTPQGSYELELSFYHSDGKEQRGLLIHDEQATYGEWVSLTSLEVTAPINPLTAKSDLQIAHPLTENQQLSLAGVRLLGYEWAETTQWRAGDAVPLTLLWQVEDSQLASANQSKLRLRLSDGERSFERKTGHQINREVTTNSLIRDIWEPYLPAQAPSGHYQLQLVAEDESPSPTDWHLNLGQIELEAREHNFELPQPKFSQQADLGQIIRLLGYKLASTAEVGEQLTIILYWQALDEMESNYTRFVHLLNSQDQLVSQRDSIPGEGALPTTTWVTGEILSEVVLLDAPADLQAGDYQVIVGFYDPSNGQRLTTSAGVDHIPLIERIKLR